MLFIKLDIVLRTTVLSHKVLPISYFLVSVLWVRCVNLPPKSLLGGFFWLGSYQVDLAANLCILAVGPLGESPLELGLPL